MSGALTHCPPVLISPGNQRHFHKPDIWNRIMSIAARGVELICNSRRSISYSPVVSEYHGARRSGGAENEHVGNRRSS